MLKLIVASALLSSTVLDTKAFALPTDPPDCATDYWAVGLEIFSESFSSDKKSHAYGTPYEYIDKDATCRSLSDQIYDKFDTFYNSKIVSCATSNPSYLNTYVSRSDLIISECKFIKQVDPELSGTEWYWYQIDVQQGMECCRQQVSPSPTPWLTTPPPTPSPSPSPSPTPSQSPTYTPEPSPTYSVSPTSTPSPYPSPS